MKRNKIYLNILACFGIAMGLSACGGGSFDTLEVHSKQPDFKNNPINYAPEPRQNEEQQDALKQSSAGFAMRNIRRNQASHTAQGTPLLDKDGKKIEVEQHVPLNPDNIIPLNHADLNNPLIDVLNKDPYSRSRNAAHSDANSQAEKYRYIRFGHIRDRETNDEEGKVKDVYHTVRSGWNVYTFYHGIEPTRSLPTQGAVKYKGQWHFMSDVAYSKGKKPKNTLAAADVGIDKSRGNGFSRNQDGDLASALAETYAGSNVAFNAEFDVNFADKTLTGDLKQESANEMELSVYKVEGEIKGNRFSGKAKSQLNDNVKNSRFVTKSLDTGNAGGDDERRRELHKAFFAADSDHLEGGFYGDNGAEMAGKFLANDNSMFVVFGAKQENPESVQKNDAIAFDALHIAKPKRSTEEYDDPEDPREETYDKAEEPERTEPEPEPETNNPDDSGVAEGDVDDGADTGAGAGADADTDENSVANAGEANTVVMASRVARSVENEDTSGNENEENLGDEDNSNPNADTDPDADTDPVGNENDGEKSYLFRRYHLSTPAERKNTFNTGNALTLYFGSHVFNLSPKEYKDYIEVSQDKDGKAKEWVRLCCSNLNYLRFGEFNLAASAGAEHVNALFIQGERTPLAEIPQSGKAKYTGTWTGFISVANAEHIYPQDAKAKAEEKADYYHNQKEIKTTSNPDYTHSASWGRSGSASKATFDVDFGNKSLTGSLFGTDASKVFGITASIQGNGFAGTASTEGDFRFDAGSQLDGYSANIANAKVEGAFYGPNAQELGGSLTYNSRMSGQFHNDVRAGAVFGATKDADAANGKTQ